MNISRRLMPHWPRMTCKGGEQGSSPFGIARAMRGDAGHRPSLSTSAASYDRPLLAWSNDRPLHSQTSSRISISAAVGGPESPCPGATRPGLEGWRCMLGRSGSPGPRGRSESLLFASSKGHEESRSKWRRQTPVGPLDAMPDMASGLWTHVRDARDCAPKTDSPITAHRMHGHRARGSRDQTHGLACERQQTRAVSSPGTGAQATRDMRTCASFTRSAGTLHRASIAAIGGSSWPRRGQRRPQSLTSPFGASDVCFVTFGTRGYRRNTFWEDCGSPLAVRSVDAC